MFGCDVKVTSRGPGLEILKKQLEELKRQQVYVGIPEEKSSRKESGEITNAELMYIHTHGSPLRKIPARPVIEPAIEAHGNKEPIVGEMALAAKSVLEASPAQAKQHMGRAGMLGQNAARAWFVDPRNNWPPNSPATVLRKLAKLRGGKRLAALDAFEQGVSSFVWRDRVFSLNTPLIDTGQLRKAIIYVIREES